MRLAVIRSECSFTKGGAERYAANLCRELTTLGHQVWVLAEIFDPEIHPDLIHIPIHVDRTTSARRNNSFNANAQKALKSLKVDHVIALSRSFPADVFRVSDPLHRFWMTLRYPGKIRRFIENLNPRHRAILALEKAIIDPQNTRLIVTNSQLSKTLIRKHYSYPPDRIHVIYNGVDFDQFHPDPNYQESDTLNFLFVGQDFKRKGLKEVILAFLKTIKAGHPAHLTVVGSDDPAPYRQLAEFHQIAPSITFTGATREIQKIYQSSDLFIFPSLYDPFANVVLEALACGLPALTTTTNGSSELITPGQNGYLVEGATTHLADDLAQQMTSFAELTPNARSLMRKKASQSASPFTTTANAKTFVEAFSNR